MKVAVVNNFVDAEIVNCRESKDNLVVGPINILFMSNMIPEKGIFELIDAVKNLLTQRPGELRLKIAGRFLSGAGLSSKDVEAKLYRSIADSSDIEYCGFAEPKTKKALLEWAHVLALPSYMREEAIPLVVLEGMAAGCYLIVSDFGVLPQLAKEVIAAVVPAKDISALQRSLATVLANRKLLSDAISINAQVARKKYSESQYIAGIDGIIHEFGGAASH